MTEKMMENDIQVSEGAPLISVITVVYNGSKTIRETINSVIRQLSNEVEYIIIDGASKDGTVDIIKEYSERLSHWVSEKDSGIYDAWNKGIKTARGRFIAFLGADDVFEPGALDSYLEFLKKHPELEYVSSRVAFGGRDGRLIGRAWRWNQFRRYMTVAHVGSLHRRDLYERYGSYNTQYKIVGDYEFLLRVGPALKAGFFDGVTVIMGADGVSNSLVSRAIYETYAAKVNTKAVSTFVAFLDLIVAWVKARIRFAK